jgi:hypothetical protein
MKHAGPDALNRLEPILARLRKLDGIREKSRGIFYRGSSAFLHFHEDPAGMFADLKIGGEFVRLRVNSAAEIAALMRKAASELSR